MQEFEPCDRMGVVVGWWDVVEGWAQGVILVLVHLLPFCASTWKQLTNHQQMEKS